jgi:hypothetical protein
VCKSQKGSLIISFFFICKSQKGSLIISPSLVICRSLFVPLSFFVGRWSVYSASDYLFGISKHFFKNDSASVDETRVFMGNQRIVPSHTNFIPLSVNTYTSLQGWKWNLWLPWTWCSLQNVISLDEWYQLLWRLIVFLITHL